MFTATHYFPTAGNRCRIFLCADAPELEGGLGFYDFAVHLQQRVGEEINRAARRLGIDYQVAALG